MDYIYVYFFPAFFRYFLFVYFSECIIFCFSFSCLKTWEICWKQKITEAEQQNHITKLLITISLTLSASPLAHVCVCFYLLLLTSVYVYLLHFRIFFHSFVRQNESGIVLICIHQIEQLYCILLSIFFVWFLVSLLLLLFSFSPVVHTIQFLISIFAVWVYLWCQCTPNESL